MLEGTKKLFPSDYDRFKETMLDAAYDEELPIALELNDIKDFTLKDFQDAFFEFQKDTGLDITGSLFICPDCGNLHMMIEVDYPETEQTMLQ